MTVIPKLPPDAEILFQADLRYWLDRTEHEPLPQAADLLRTFWMLGQLARLPVSTIVAMECQNLEVLGREPSITTR